METPTTQPRVVVAGASGVVGRALLSALEGKARVRALTRRADVAFGPGVDVHRCDLTSIPQAEVSLAGADVVVFLARTSSPPARLSQAHSQDVDLLMADAVARATARVGARRLVLFACAGDDEREAVLRGSGVEVVALRGGGAAPGQALADLALGAETKDVALAPWTGPDVAPQAAPPDAPVASVQRLVLPEGWSAQDVALAHMRWLGRTVPLVRTESLPGATVVRAAGAPVLVLRHAVGRSEADSFVFEVRDGALMDRAARPGRFEFRVVQGTRTVLAALFDYTSALPFPVYRVTQALIHGAVMKRFGRWLELSPAR